MATQALVQQLQRRIERIETASRTDDGQVISSGCAAMDGLLPGGGYRRGTLVEWVGDCSGGCGASYLSLLAAANACADGGALVIADGDRQFNPPAAAAIGIDLGNVVVIRPSQETRGDRRQDEEFFWAIDQALGCSAVAAVWGGIDRIGERWFRRFQLSVEASGSMGLFVRPTSAMDRPAWSEVRWRVKPQRSPVVTAATQQLELTLARCRGARSGQCVELSIDTVTGVVTSSVLRMRASS